jgi:hypothetical protein
MFQHLREVIEQTRETFRLRSWSANNLIVTFRGCHAANAAGNELKTG